MKSVQMMMVVAQVRMERRMPYLIYSDGFKP